MKLIGVTGKAGSGKDTVAEYLVREYGFERYGFADPIKQGLCAAFGLMPFDFADRARKEQPIERLGGKSPRQLAQWFGTEFGRNMICEDIWIRMAQFRYDALVDMVRNTFGPAPVGMVVSDVRFENEAAWIRKTGGAVWHVVRPVIESVAAHVSEAGVAFADGDRWVHNYGTISELHECIDGLMLENVREDGC